MTKILLICHDIPSMTVGATLPIYHLIRLLGSDYNINLITFDSNKYSIKSIENNINQHKTIKIPEYLSIKDQFTYTFKNMFSTDNLHTRSFLNYYYSSTMSRLIKKEVDSNNYDVIITDMPMAFYVANVSIPKIVYAFDCVSNYNKKMYQKADTPTQKIYWYLNYLKIHSYEKVYNKFDSCIVVNQKDKKLLEKDIKTSITVVANGVDTTFFSNNKKDEIKLVFLGDMSTPPNNDAVKYFIEEIYPLVLKEENIKFYIVGRNPSNYIKSLNKNDNIIVTGSVEDVREYLQKDTIFITPMISGTGIKNKILEAMSMNLPVISTSIGISGINARNNVHYMLADSPIEFKNAIIELIRNPQLREEISSSARLFVENNYSWNKSTKKIEEIINKIVS